MSDATAFGGRAYVADTSAWARGARRAAAEAWSRAMLAGQLWMTPVVKLELLYSTRDQQELADLERRLDDMREAPLDRSVARTAVAALRELAAMGPLDHRVPITDALIAAGRSRARRGSSALRRALDRLACVLGFESRWIVERGAA